MRIKYQDVFCDGNGRVVHNGTVTVYVAGSSTLATIYSTSIIGTPIAGSTVTTEVDGSFSFWINSYADGIKLVLTKDQYVQATYDYIYPPGFVGSVFEISHFGGETRPGAFERVFIYIASSSFVLSDGLPGSYAWLQTAPTAQTTFLIYKNGLPIGSVVFEAGENNGTIDCYTDTAFVAGDRLTIHAGEQDDTAAGFAFSLRTT